MCSAKGVTTPMFSHSKLTKHGYPILSYPNLYHSMVGALQYVTLTRYDITFIVNQACQFMVSPLESHWPAIKRIL